MIGRLALLAVLAGVPFVTGQPALAKSIMDHFVGAPAEAFPSVEALTQAFKERLSADDRDGLAKLLGLNAKELAKADDIEETITEIRGLAAQSVSTKEETPGQQTLVLGEKLWPFPFPIVKQGDSWAFATKDGLDEVLDRRIGEDELQVIATMKAYVDSQETYHRTDWDDDGVLEYAQKLISTPGEYDGLYWEEGDGVPDSPAGPFVSEDELTKANDKDIGYYGYHFRVLKAQGANVDGGAYKYVINGNMIAGFALIAWPATYGDTGYQTFIINQAGTVYEKDLGPNSDAAANAIIVFNPDKTWRLSDDDNANVSAALPATSKANTP